jgi:type I restriction enzyme R subunit
VTTNKPALPGTPAVNLVGEKDLNAPEFVSTCPTLMNMINEMDGTGLADSDF